MTVTTGADTPMQVLLAQSDSDIEDCFDALKALRPHLVREEFLPRVRRQQAQGYQLLALRIDGRVPSAAGFRFAEFLAWGHVLYIDDLTTLTEFRGRGYGDVLMTWMIDHARSRGCQGVHLDTGYTRHAAHRLYLRKGFRMTSHHLALTIDECTDFD